MFNNLKKNSSFAFLSQYFNFYKKYLIFALITTIVISVITFPIPLISRYIIDELIPGSNINKVILFRSLVLDSVLVSFLCYIGT